MNKKKLSKISLVSYEALAKIENADKYKHSKKISSKKAPEVSPLF